MLLELFCLIFLLVINNSSFIQLTLGFNWFSVTGDQVTSKKINFIVDEHSSDSNNDDGASTSGQCDQQDKDRSWLISSLHQIYSRR
jgi:hypothetical protein